MHTELVDGKNCKQMIVRGQNCHNCRNLPPIDSLEQADSKGYNKAA